MNTRILNIIRLDNFLKPKQYFIVGYGIHIVQTPEKFDSNSQAFLQFPA